MATPTFPGDTEVPILKSIALALGVNPAVLGETEVPLLKQIYVAIVALLNSSAAGGISQLTGEVTAGPGSGSQAALVTRPTSAEVLAVAIATRSLSPLSLKQYVAPQTFTDAATTAFNVALGCNAIWTIGGDRLLQNPTNLYPGASGNFWIIQGSGGSHAITFDTAYESAGSSAIVLSTNAGDKDLLSWYSPDGTTVVVMLNDTFGAIP